MIVLVGLSAWLMAAPCALAGGEASEAEAPAVERPVVEQVQVEPPATADDVASKADGGTEVAPETASPVDAAPETDKAEEGASEAQPDETEAAHAGFNMDVLIERLKNTDAIGVFTKLALRSDAMDIIESVKKYREHEGNESLDQIRAQFNGLLLKVLALLDDDPSLSHAISTARENIWQSLLEAKA